MPLRDTVTGNNFCKTRIKVCWLSAASGKKGEPDNSATN